VSRAFRLAGLLRLRALAEEQAAAQRAASVRGRDTATARAAATQAALASAEFPGMSDSRGVQAVVASRLALSALLVDRRAQVLVAQDEVDAADAAWSEARTRTRTLEKLQEKHDTAVRAEEQRAEQLVLDEVAGRRTAARPGATAPEGDR
jgi:flagellar FliJ protein